MRLMRLRFQHFTIFCIYAVCSSHHRNASNQLCMKQLRYCRYTIIMGLLRDKHLGHFFYSFLGFILGKKYYVFLPSIFKDHSIKHVEDGSSFTQTTKIESLFREWAKWGRNNKKAKPSKEMFLVSKFQFSTDLRCNKSS